MSAQDDSRQVSDERYVVVARRYRPKSFGELVGQQHVGQALCNAIETGRVGHAYLFTGARGVGKTSTARIFAKALNDPGGPTCSPDGLSDTAQAIDAGEDVDVLEIDGASNRGIDEIRSLRANVGVRPSRSRYKIYIIDEVHMLTAAAFNALLKTLEEPPPHVKFIFCTTDPEKIPITVLSRCQRFDFSPVKSEEIMGRLREIVTAEGMDADDEALRLIARRADGSMRDSQSLLEQVISFSSGPINAQSVHMMLGTADDTRLHEMAQVLVSGNAASALALVDRAASEGIAAGQFTEQLLGYFRDLIAVTVGCPAEMQRHTSEALHSELRALGEQWGVDRLLAIVGMIDQTLVRIRHTVHGRVLLEATLVQICHLPNLQSIADIIASISGGAPRASSGQATGGQASGGQATRPAISVNRPADANEKKNIEPAPLTAAQVVPSAKPGAIEPLAVEPARLDVAHATKPSSLAATPNSLTMSRPVAATTAMAGRPSIRTDAGPTSGGVAVSSAPIAQKPTGASAEKNEGTRLALTSGESAVPAPVIAKTRVQRIREMEAHRYVKSCIDMFDGEIIRIDLPRKDDIKASAFDEPS